MFDSKIMPSIEEVKHLQIPLQDILLATNDFHNCIGSGGYGTVYKGISEKHGPIAVKRLYNAQGQGGPEFKTEIALLSQYRHENIVSFVGFCDEDGERILVYKYESNGSLDKHLNSQALTWTQRLKICIDAARGLEYLHSGVGQRILHRDIKSSNILLDENWKAKISDFGLSRLGPANMQSPYLTSAACGTIGYIDPDYLNTGLLTKEYDVYAFGVVLFEVLCGRLAYATSYKDEHQLLTKLVQKHYEEGTLDRIIHPDIQNQAKRASLLTFSSIAYQCLKNQTEERPRMTKVVEQLLKALVIQEEPNVSASVVYDDLSEDDDVVFVADHRGDSRDLIMFDLKTMPSIEEVKHLQIPLQDILLATNRFANRNCIGSGGYGMVYKGISEKHGPIAVQRLDRALGQGDPEFKTEIALLSQYRHENILSFVGFCDEDDEEILVYKYETNVSLDKHLNSQALTWTQRLKICTDAAHGLEYLHSGVGPHQRILHRDVKSSDILLDENSKAKISDFGLSRLGPANMQSSSLTSNVLGTRGYVDPHYRYLTQESDVYSFGVVLLEILYGRLAHDTSYKYDGQNLADLVQKHHTRRTLDEIILSDLHKQINTSSLLKFSKIVYQCLKDGDERPSLNEVMKQLQKALDNQPEPNVSDSVLYDDLSEDDDIDFVADHHCRQSRHARDVERFIDTISHKLLSVLSSSNEALVAIETHIQDLKPELEIGAGGVCMVGIWGVEGRDLTTIASSIYNEIYRYFKGCCYVENIWEKSSEDGLGSLQEQILSDVLKHELEAGSVEKGKRIIKSRLCFMKVLIVLDDVDHIDQLEGSHDRSGVGSRIIITTKDEHFSRVHKVDVIYNISFLDDNEASELFHKHAFRDYNRRTNHHELITKAVVSYAGGFPLGLNILGYFFPRLNGNLLIHFWKGYKYLLHLRQLTLSDVHGIVTTPDFGELPCLQLLRLHYCGSLEEIHPSLGRHAGLFYLSILRCRKLRMLPTITRMKKLKSLEILDCDALLELPEIHSVIYRHWSLLTADTIAAFSRGLSSWPSSNPIPAVYSQRRNHDIFLSFIEDFDSKTFVDVLYSSLIQEGIHTYKSDGTPHSDLLSPSLLNAIEESQIAIIIFTKTYAGSSWCLDELSYIMKCIDMRGLHVMPIFYDVSSKDVHEQYGGFGKEFDKQEFQNMAKVKSWRKALKGACKHSGWSLKHLANRDEGRYIKDIVATVSHRLFSLISKVKNDLIGIGPRLQNLTSTLAIGSDDVRMVVVGGAGGSGKTTIASCVYMEISRQFNGRCFVENIREESRKYGMKKLQQKILSTILKKEVDIPSEEEGTCMMRSMLRDRKVLIVLDDVIDPHQLDSLAGSRDWFGRGSRVIITSREKHVLLDKVDALYDVSLLSDDEANELFHKYVYMEYEPVGKENWKPSSSFLEAYDKLSRDVISYADGLPLTLKILGSFLHDKDKDEWISALTSLRDIPSPRLMNKLKISYDGLQPDEKELFLDIACFFKGGFVDSSMMLLLDAFYVQLITKVNVLVQKSLITISNGIFDMHDLVQEMGHCIVRGEHPVHPEKHTRVWEWNDVAHICAIHTTKENDKIQALYAPDYDAPPNLLKVVANMKSLWLLNVRQHVKEVVEEPLFLSNELRWISWENYPASSFPASFQPKMLLSLTLRNSLQKVLWQDYKYLPRLKVLDLDGSVNLITTPDFNGLPNLERLILSGCSSLTEIDPSIGYHERLRYLNLYDCEKLETFAPIVRMRKLETLILSRCSRLLKFPEIKGRMNGLQYLYLDYSGIEAVPSTVGQYCTNLVSINLIGCVNLKRIEGNFQRLKRRCVIMVDARATRN